LYFKIKHITEGILDNVFSLPQELELMIKIGISFLLFHDCPRFLPLQ